MAEFQEDQHQGLRGRDGGDGEVGAAKTKAQPADRQARQHRHHAAGDHPDPGRDAEIDLQDGRGVGAEAEIGGVPERQLLGVAAHQVPGDAEEREQQDADEDVDRKRAFDDQRQGDEHNCARRERQQSLRSQSQNRHRALPPPRPVGLNASVSSSIANTTSNPESAPTNWMPSDSATPIIRLAISAPMTLPSVPSTTATKAISTKVWPTNG